MLLDKKGVHRNYPIACNGFTNSFKEILMSGGSLPEVVL